MLMALRDYLRPTTLTEAVRLLRAAEGRAALLAGGTELVGRNDDHLEAVISLKGLLSDQIVREGSILRIGALATLQSLTQGESILARAARQAAPATIRRSATLGGTLAGEKGGWEVPTALLAMGATVVLATPTLREIPLGAFLANRAAALEGAIITEVRVPEQGKAGIAWVSRTPMDRAILVAAATVDGPVQRVAVGGLAPYPRMIDPLLEQWPAISEHLASGEYRRKVTPVLIRRALEEAEQA